MIRSVLACGVLLATLTTNASAQNVRETTIMRVFLRPSGTSIGAICLARNPVAMALPARC